MSVLAIEDDLEPLYTLKQAAALLAFPSVDALRMYLARRPGLVVERYRRVGRSNERLLSESEIRQLRAAVVKT